MSIKPKKNPRFLYSKETLNEALAAVQAGMPINTASSKYHIPRSTLHNKRNAKYADKRPGPDTVLTLSEENLLVNWIINCSKLGMYVNKQHLLNSVALLVKFLNRENPFANGRPGRHWYQSFLRRHSNVVDTINENSAITKTVANETAVRKWFSNVRCFLEEKKILNIDSSRIFTTDSITLQSSDVTNDKGLVIQMMGNAAGKLVPPMILHSYPITNKIVEQLPKGWFCSNSDNGRMTAENLYEYITTFFHPWLVENKIEFPIVLFIDGRVTHLTLLLSDYCIKNKIELVGLYPNCSNILQPLDIGLFPSIKSVWQKALNKYHSETKAVNLLQENVAPLLKSVLETLDVNKILIVGFASSGLYPFSENAINYSKLPKKGAEKVQVERLEYTPFIQHELLITRIEEPNATNLQFLTLIEKTLNPDVLQSFKSVKESEEWTGRVEDTSLFYFWRKVANLCKTDSEYFTSQPNTANENFATMDVSETGIQSTLNVKTESIELIDVDPLKVCVTEMK